MWRDRLVPIAHGRWRGRLIDESEFIDVWKSRQAQLLEFQRRRCPGLRRWRVWGVYVPGVWRDFCIFFCERVRGHRSREQKPIGWRSVHARKLDHGQGFVAAEKRGEVKRMRTFKPLLRGLCQDRLVELLRTGWRFLVDGR